MIRRAFALIALAAGLCGAHEPITTKLTWTREISRIVYKRCAGCHREGGSAPMSLLSYDEARPWAKAIKEEVLERRMPPWGAVKGFGDFKNDASLPEREIELIAAWVEGGAPKGEDIHLPRLPHPSPSDEVAPRTKQIAVRGSLTLGKDVVALGILPENPSIQATAQLPNGSVRPLVWVRNIRAEWLSAYYFREPLQLPKGTRIRVSAEQPQEKEPPAVILLVRP